MPILKEFDLDIPYISTAGTKEDYEATWKEKRFQFRDQIRCIVSLYERSFDKLKTTDSWKVLIDCVDEITDEKVKDFSGVCSVQVQFNVDSFFTKDDHQKKEVTIEILRKGLDKVITEKGWDQVPFGQAFEKVIEVNMKNEWFWRKPISSPDRRFKARLYIVHEVTVVIGYLIVFNNTNQEILRTEAFRDRPNEWAYVQYLGDIQWLSSNEVALFSKGNELVRQVSFIG
ncbi:hypothetical protein [Paenibacillus sp. BC26]|uniref:hypothetical protein n=1 Tax=Paenibacillus sp. BC26 TaxID=1881032 RepID=UPI0008E56CDB|nr:hypothetical protein [Paenibacillus sp. BC26]SFS76268.1 hypothetical protein SAMN05428962_2708 [Paenibacillus sp. BC26]